VRRVVETLLARGRTERGFLGIGAFPVNLPANLIPLVGQATALIVLSVQPQSPAERAGMLLGDALVSLDGRPLSGIGDLLELLDEERIGAECAIQIVRAGELKTINVTIRGRSAA
jgi:S1-C subfamily serine protease